MGVTTVKEEQGMLYCHLLCSKASYSYIANKMALKWMYKFIFENIS